MVTQGKRYGIIDAPEFALASWLAEDHRSLRDKWPLSSWEVLVAKYSVYMFVL